MAPDFHVIRLWRHVLCRLADEAIAAAMCGFNEAWRCRVIVESLANLPNSHFEDSIPDKGPWPDGVEKFFFRDELARTSTGKLQKFKLRAPFWEGRERQVN